MTEILEELPRLGHSERQAILRRLIELDAGIDIEETSQMLAAIDAGVSSLATGSGVPLEQARQRIAGWAIR
jgi:predicted transcriptional regulator